MNIVIFGLSITSSWGNGHATTYRALVRALERRGHQVLFFERDVPWYADNRDMPDPPFGMTVLYDDLASMQDRWHEQVRGADLAVIGSYVPDGIALGDWMLETATGVTAFYDIDTPVTVDRLRRRACDYVAPEQVARYDLYLSFTGGAVLEQLAGEFGARHARPLFCSVDPDAHAPSDAPVRWDLGYLGTYSADRQPALEERLLIPARRWARGRFVVAGPQFPPEVAWPGNVDRVNHLPPHAHRDFYCGQRFTLNVTRSAMVQAGFSPSVRLFEAAACGTPIISDPWEGLEHFFEPEDEILVTRSADETLDRLRGMSSGDRKRIGENARARVLAHHTSGHRARELETYWEQARA